jgi:hypothetical protein
MQRPLLSQRDDCAYTCDPQPTTPILHFVSPVRSFPLQRRSGQRRSRQRDSLVRRGIEQV